jgi:hypothetical protein
MRWRIERDYQELKQECRLGHYEGRGWRGFHHHATLCIAAYCFLTMQRLQQPVVKKTMRNQNRLAYPTITSLAGAGRAPRHVSDSVTTLRANIASVIAATTTALSLMP